MLYTPHNPKLRLAVGLFALFQAVPIVAAGELHDAVRANDAETVIALLESGASVDETDFLLGAPLHIAASQGSVEAARILIDHNADLEAASEQDGAKAMHLAATFSDIEMLKILLDGGADIDSRDAFGRTPLLQAALFGHAHAVDWLLKRGADFERKDFRQGSTPLMIACYAGRLDVVRLLVEKGADIEARNNSGRTALWEAALPQSWSAAGGPAVIEYLVAQGADVHTRENSGASVLAFTENRASAGGLIWPEIAGALRRLGATE